MDRGREDALDLLEQELQRHHRRDFGEEAFRCVGELARRLAASDRPGLARALGAWLKPGTGTRALIALRLAGELRLTELRGALERYRKDVLAGRCGGGRDPWMIDEALEALGP